MGGPKQLIGVSGFSEVEQATELLAALLL